MNRRGFLGSILALASAPAIVRADSLMRIVPRQAVIVPLGDIAAGDIISIEGVTSLFRVVQSYDLSRDEMIVRVETTNGQQQHDVSMMFASGYVIGDIDLAPAKEVLKAHIKHHHGGLDGWEAPPLFADPSIKQWVTS